MAITINRRELLALGSAALVGALPSPALAAWPDKPVTWVLPFGPGLTDSVSRIVAESLTQSLGQRVLVDNRPGAAGTIGAESASRAAADGYTLLFGTTGTHVVQPLLNTQLRYDPIKDFQPVHGLFSVPQLLVVASSKPWRGVADLVDYARKNPGKLNYGSSGIGAVQHLAAELLSRLADVKMTHVPYVSIAQARTDVASGDLDLLFDHAVDLMPLVDGGKLRPLGLTSDKRLEMASGIPVMAEVGYPALQLSTWAALFVPAKTPDAVVTQLAEMTAKALREERMTAFAKTAGISVWTDIGPRELGAFVGSELPRVRDLLARAGALPK